MRTSEYSLAQAFRRIEDWLIKSMIRNLKRHKAEEAEEGFLWEQWQALQLKELAKYKQRNREKFSEEFEEINQQIDELFRVTAKDAQTKEEAALLKQIKDNNFQVDTSSGVQFFGVNEGKLDAIVKATTDDLDKAEAAVLRRADDIYRRVIYDAQVYAASGTASYEQAIDMATKDFARRGIDSIVYKNGARHSISEYASMAIRTGNKRAYLLGQGKTMDKLGVHTVHVKKRDACPLCLRWTGRVLIDDVFASGTAEEAREKGYPLLSMAMNMGFLHPNCKDIYTPFIAEVKEEPEPWTEEELEELAREYNLEQKIKKAKREADSWQRVADTRLDPENRRIAQARADEWRERETQYISSITNYRKVPFGELARKELPLVEGQDLASLMAVDKDSPFEIGTIYDEYDNIILRLQGNETRIDLFNDDLALLKGRYFSHNHSNGNTLNIVDFETVLLEGRAKGLRAITPDGTTFSLVNAGATEEQLQAFYDQWKATNEIAVREAEKEFTERYKYDTMNKGKLLSYTDYRLNILAHYILETYAKLYGLEYKVIRD